MLAIFFDDNLLEGLNLFKEYRTHKKIYDQLLIKHRNNIVLFGFYDPETQKSLADLENLKVRYFLILEKIKAYNKKNKIENNYKTDIQNFIDYIEDELLGVIYQLNERFFNENDIEEFFNFLKDKKTKEQNQETKQ